MCNISTQFNYDMGKKKMLVIRAYLYYIYVYIPEKLFACLAPSF